MRDAFGGVFTTNFLLVFIFIYIAVTAVSLNYAKAFKVKNAMIDFVEQHEVTDLDDFFGPTSKEEKRTKIDEILANLSYHKTCKEIGYRDDRFDRSDENHFGEDEYCYKGVVLTEDRIETIAGTDSKVAYYKIKTYASWDLGAFNKLLSLVGKNSNEKLTGSWAVNGEAKVVIK
jgi:hypothetical protein